LIQPSFLRDAASYLPTNDRKCHRSLSVALRIPSGECRQTPDSKITDHPDPLQFPVPSSCLSAGSNRNKQLKSRTRPGAPRASPQRPITKAPSPNTLGNLDVDSSPFSKNQIDCPVVGSQIPKLNLRGDLLCRLLESRILTAPSSLPLLLQEKEAKLAYQACVLIPALLFAVIPGCRSATLGGISRSMSNIDTCGGDAGRPARLTDMSEYDIVADWPAGVPRQRLSVHFSKVRVLCSPFICHHSLLAAPIPSPTWSMVGAESGGNSSWQRYCSGLQSHGMRIEKVLQCHVREKCG
jgi:hypothetical protein